MNRAQTITTTTIDRWLLPHIAGVIKYAETDAAFALTLATWLDEENWSITPVPKVTASPHLIPVDTEHADDVVDWLMHELATHPEARIARSVLVGWASDYVAPQDVVIGIEGIAIVGPTLGLIKRTKKKSQLQIVVDDAWLTEQSATDFTETTHTISQDLIAVELRKAGGKIGSLHPDTAEWCMGVAGTKIYNTKDTTVKDVYEAALADQLHHHTLKVNGTPVAIAISPSVNDAFVEELVP